DWNAAAAPRTDPRGYCRPRSGCADNSGVVQVDARFLQQPARVARQMGMAQLRGCLARGANTGIRAELVDRYGNRGPNHCLPVQPGWVRTDALQVRGFEM